MDSLLSFLESRWHGPTRSLLGAPSFRVPWLEGFPLGGPEPTPQRQMLPLPVRRPGAE